MKKTILITGASSGIGKATAKFFAQQGWNVVATMRKPEQETELAHLDNVLVSRLDVTDRESIKGAVSEALEKFGSIDALVNNAGYGALGLLEAFDMEGIERQFDTNIIGLISVTKEVLPHMRAKKDGAIVNISSVGGKVAYPLGGLYHGTKYAVEGFSEGLYYELASIGVKVKIVEPGAIATDFNGRSFDFRNDINLLEYQELVNKLMKTFGNVMNDASSAEFVAEIIYGAVTDGSDRFRYIAGKDAEETIAVRTSLDDETFMNAIKQEVGLV